MKIVILDGNALNPGDLSWKPLEKYGNVTIYPRTSTSQVIERIGSSDAVLLNKINITEDILTACPSLKYIGVQATGYNVIDLDSCRKHNVTVTNVPSYSTDAVAQMVFSYITEFSNHVQVHSNSVHSGDWIKCPDFCYWKVPLFELAGKTLGIFGYGHIGRKVAQIAKAYSMNVIVHTRTPNSEIENPVSLEELFKKSDFLTLHAPLTEQTKEIINSKTLSLMKKSSYLINTARGGLVNENDVKAALVNKTIAGYAADVLTNEPMKSDCPLYKAPNCLITPHISWAAVETRQRLLNIVVENLAHFVAGTPQNVVS